MNGVHDEEKILADLRRIAAAVDPVPAGVIASARAVLSLRRLDAELVELVRDSAEDRQELVAVRGSDDVRMLSFELPPITIELQVTERNALRDLLAHVSGVELASAALETHDDRRELDPDGGVLVVDGVTSGLARLHLTTSDNFSYTTNWVRI